MTNSGRFPKLVRRFQVNTLFSSKVHAMVYDREDRTWSVACIPGSIPDAGHMIPVGEPQPEVTCKSCNQVRWT